MNSSILNRVILSVGLLPAAVCWAGYPVDINSADAAELAAALDGVGQTKAEAIVAYREAQGPFTSAEALTEVSGIGKATLARNLEYILVGESDVDE